MLDRLDGLSLIPRPARARARCSIREDLSNPSAGCSIKVRTVALYRFQIDPGIAANTLALVPSAAMHRHRLGKGLSAPGRLLSYLGPDFPALPETRADAPLLLPGDTAFLDPLGE